MKANIINVNCHTLIYKGNLYDKRIINSTNYIRSLEPFMNLPLETIFNFEVSSVCSKHCGIKYWFLNTRIANVLYRNDIAILDNLRKYTLQQLLEIRGISSDSVSAIFTMLKITFALQFKYQYLFAEMVDEEAHY